MHTTHGHSTQYTPRLHPAEFNVTCRTLHSARLGTYICLMIGPLVLDLDRRQLHQLIAECQRELDNPTPTEAEKEVEKLISEAAKQ